MGEVILWIWNFIKLMPTSFNTIWNEEAEKDGDDWNGGTGKRKKLSYETYGG